MVSSQLTESILFKALVQFVVVDDGGTFFQLAIEETNPRVEPSGIDEEFSLVFLTAFLNFFEDFSFIDSFLLEWIPEQVSNLLPSGFNPLLVLVSCNH